MTRLARSLIVMFRSQDGSAKSASGISSAIWNWYQADFLLARCTVQRISAFSVVSSATGMPAAFKP